MYSTAAASPPPSPPLPLPLPHLRPARRLYSHSHVEHSLPTARRPDGANKQLKHMRKKAVQDTARYPYRRASVLSLPALRALFVYVDETTDMTARPVDAPNWATTLKTAPASPCIFGGNTLTTMRWAMVKTTASVNIVSRCRSQKYERVPSVETAVRSIDQKTAKW